MNTMNKKMELIINKLTKQLKRLKFIFKFSSK